MRSIALPLTLIFASAALAAQTPANLVATLQKGGCVLVMRHVSSPREVPDAATANADNTTRERQLDAVGRASATAFGEALRRLHIPVGTVLSSPTYRAEETIRLAQLPAPALSPELGENGASMQAVTDAQAEWLRKKAAEFSAGTNTILVTHFPNITRAFPDNSKGIGDGEALVFGSDGKGGAMLIARVKIEEWPQLDR